MRIKILMKTEYTYDEDYYGEVEIIKGITGWEDVTEEEYDKLQKYCCKKVINTFSKKSHYFIIVDLGLPVIECLEDFRIIMIAEEAEKEEKAAKKQKKFEEKKRRKETTQRERDLKNLKELQDKYPS